MLLLPFLLRLDLDDLDHHLLLLLPRGGDGDGGGGAEWRKISCKLVVLWCVGRPRRHAMTLASLHTLGEARGTASWAALLVLLLLLHRHCVLYLSGRRHLREALRVRRQLHGSAARTTHRRGGIELAVLLLLPLPISKVHGLCLRWRQALAEPQRIAVVVWGRGEARQAGRQARRGVM